jgi:hypothetical protein
MYVAVKTFDAFFDQIEQGSRTPALSDHFGSLRFASLSFTLAAMKTFSPRVAQAGASSIVKRSSVVPIGVRRGRAGRDNCHLWSLPCAAEDNQAGVLQR